MLLGSRSVRSTWPVVKVAVPVPAVLLMVSTQLKAPPWATVPPTLFVLTTVRSGVCLVTLDVAKPVFVATSETHTRIVFAPSTSCPAVIGVATSDGLVL